MLPPDNASTSMGRSCPISVPRAGGTVAPTIHFPRSTLRRRNKSTDSPSALTSSSSPRRATLLFGELVWCMPTRQPLTSRIWDIPSLSNTPVATLEGHTANVTALAYSAKGKWIVTGSEDGTVKVWDTR